MSRNFLGISEAFNHAVEWEGRYAIDSTMIKKDYSPSLRATDYKCPKYAWYVIETD